MPTAGGPGGARPLSRGCGYAASSAPDSALLLDSNNEEGVRKYSFTSMIQVMNASYPSSEAALVSCVGFYKGVDM